jgi:hypothetical protein
VWSLICKISVCISFAENELNGLDWIGLDWIGLDGVLVLNVLVKSTTGQHISI